MSSDAADHDRVNGALMTGTDRAEVTRDRFLAFAFAAADLLIETSLDGTIGFAAGAFRRYFAVDGERFIDRRITSLVAPGDHTPLAMALATVTHRGRIAPLVLRLNNAASTPASVAAMLMPGPRPRLCFTVGPLPLEPAGPPPGIPVGMQDPAVFLHEAEAALRHCGDRMLGMVELKGWKAAKSALSAQDQRDLTDGIGALLTGSGPGIVAGEISEGRYGVVGAAEMDLAQMVVRLDRLVRASPAGRHARVEETNLTLHAGGLAASQAARALRDVVGRFADGGVEAATAVGARGGLEGIVAQVELRARAMREIIEARRFRLQYQPVVALADQQAHHFEALLRPTPTPANPAHTTQDFVLLAEAVGLSEELDWAVLQETLAALRATPRARIAVNISGLSMQSRPFRERILDEVSRNPEPSRLLVELTETAEIEDLQGAADSIARLRAAGVAVCIDDFGAGAAAFRYLREFHVDFVKIDGAYVRAATRSARERSFVASMVELATAAGAKTVAEMIETEEQARLMRELGVEFGQGWLFGRPGSLPGARR